jgi:AcrR family transcriptional regulator
MAEKLTNRAKQALTTKKRIYQCGIGLMQQHGYENITVEQIAKKSNVSVGTFYHYFQSKFELLVEIYRQGDEFFLEHTPEILKKNMSCLEKIKEYFLLYAVLSLRDGIDSVRNLYVPTNRMFITHGRAMQDLLIQIIKAGQESGEITDSLLPDNISEKLFIAARGVIFDWCLHDGKSDLKKDMADIMGRLSMSYLNKQI